jgi:RNA polymerase sigma-70 factor (ECF subfamily)
MRPLHCGEWQTVTTKTADSFTDLELAAQSAAGDVAAFEQLYERHRRRVYSLCLRMVGDVTEAEDITQEVFLQVFRKIGTFRGEAALTTWLHRLAVNHVLMHWRKRGIRSEEMTEEGDVGGIARPYPLSILDRIALEQAVQKLPPGYRLVFLLHDVEGYEHEEIAAMLGCSVGTSKSQLHKARLKLRSLLRGEG